MNNSLTRTCAWALILAMLFAAPTLEAQAAKKAKSVAEDAPQGPLPWVLRARYTITLDKVSFEFDEAKGDWRLFIPTGDPAGDTIMQGPGPQVTLGDGSVLSAEMLGDGKTDRESVATPLGDGTFYTLRFPPKDGLTVAYRVNTFKQWDFLFVTLSVTNGSEKPVEVSELSPLVMGSGGMIGWGPDTKVTARHLNMTTGCPLYDKSQAPAMTTFQDPARGLCVAMGVVPRGRAASSASFPVSAGSWMGKVTSQYTPAVTLAPGAVLESDPLWLSYGMRAIDADQKYAWALSKMPRPELNWDVWRGIRGWVTVDDAGDLGALCRAAALAPGMGLKHALIPAAWEGRPGSLEGAAPRYPKNMANAAKALREAGATPGITVDPIVVQGGKADWTVKSADGQTWVNLGVAEGRAFAEKRMRTVADCGFGFLVVAPSAVPDEALKSFGQTRAEADRLAFETVLAAAGGLPVFPASRYACNADSETLRAAAAVTARLGSFLIIPGPLRVQADGLRELAEDGMPLRLWPGPVELLGMPASAGREALAKALSAPRLDAIPMDLANPSPKLWRVSASRAADGCPGAAILCFAGAPEWKVDDVKPDKGVEYLVWKGSDGQVVDATQGVRPSADFETYGLTPQAASPTFMGVLNMPALGLNQVDTMKWDEAQGILSGSIKGSLDTGARACVYVPEPWNFDSGKSGDQNIRKGAMTGRVLCFDLAGSGGANFTLKFSK
jgi:hypothetical protein